MSELSRRSRRLAGFALMTLGLGCSGDDGPTGPATGSLTVNVSGLPIGVAGSITVTGPAGFTRTLTTTETVSALTPGSYTVTSATVTAPDGKYEPASATQVVAVVAGTTPAVTAVNYALATGSLSVAITGLPNGVNGAVTVTGPNQFTRLVTTTTILTALEPGTYSIAGAEVSSADERFAPAPPNQSVAVAAGVTPVSTSVAYSLSSGRLAVTVSGLPGGAGSNAAVTVTGPGGFTRTVTATTVLTQLAPGLYAVNASNVVTGGFTWRPTPATQTVIVSVSTTPSTASVSYAVVDGSLALTITGLPPGVSGSVTVANGAGFSQIVTGTTTLTALPPGVYSITAASVSVGATSYSPAPVSQFVTVTAATISTASVGYSSMVLRLETVATGFSLPLQLTAPPGDARLFIVEQAGRIKIIQNAQILPQLFLDLSTRVLPIDPSDEHGLLGLAFHPQYATNGSFYVFYMDLSQDLVIERYQVSANPNVANTAGTLVLKIPHRTYLEHNGGGLAFGPDGFLYVSVGDGGCCIDPLRTGQDLNTLLGKVLRIDVNTAPYVIPASNPFINQAGKRGEIWAYGLRNPWRFDIDAQTSVLYIADVGEDEREEVNAVPLNPGGLNFGWSILEGTRCVQAPCSSQGTRLPVVEYNHVEGCSVTGGFVYRGTQIPELQGHYLYSDYCTGFLRSFLFANGSATQPRDWNITSPGSVTSFGKDATGELYMLTQDGTVFRIVKQ